MISYPYNRIPHPIQDTKRERNTNKTAKGKLTHAGSQEDSFFPADGHRAIRNKINKKQKETRRMNADNLNKQQQKHRLGTASNKLLGV